MRIAFCQKGREPSARLALRRCRRHAPRRAISLDPSSTAVVRCAQSNPEEVPMRRTVYRTAIGALAAVLLSAGLAHAQTPVTVCGQIVGGDAVLANDLDCAPNALAGVLHLGGRLDLAGHTIRGAQYGVLCAEPLWDQGLFIYRKCRVSGGTLADFTINGVNGQKLDLVDLAFSGAEDTFAIYGHKSVRFANIHIDNLAGSVGILGFALQTVKGTNITIEGGEIGIAHVGKATIDGIAVNGAADQGISGKTIKVTHGSVTAGTVGVAAVNAKVAATTVTGAETGILANRMQLKDSTVTGNALDLDSTRAPKLKNTACDTSNGWGVCAND
jgi:hypothetical protein